MNKLLTLIDMAIVENEPVLLVGETGCGKTMAAYIMAQLYQREMVSVSCHANT